MSTNTSSQPQGEPPFPSFNELRSAGTPVGLSPAARRLHWTLTGDYPSAISVMKTKHYDGQLDAFFRLDEGATGSGNWHEIATLPLTEPKVSSIEASLLDLEQWESDWMAWHADHSAPGFGQIYWTYADLSDDDRPFRDEPDEDGNWEADSDTEFLVSCCGDDRPLRKKGLKITVTPSAGSNFVSVRDYVSVVHPWFMGLKEDILQSKKIARPQPYFESVYEIQWMVSCLLGPQHEITTKGLWVEMHRAPQPLDAGTLRFLQRIGARTAQQSPEANDSNT